MSPNPSTPRDNPQQLLTLASLLGRGVHDMEAAVGADSMTPTLLPRDSVRVRTGRSEPVRRGTVVAYVSPTGVMPRRVVHRGAGPWARQYIVPRGDACLLCDPPMAVKSIMGTVVAYRRIESWLPLDAAPRGRPVRTVVRAALALPVLVALELHVDLARAVAISMLRLGRVVAFVVRRRMHS